MRRDACGPFGSRKKFKLVAMGSSREGGIKILGFIPKALKSC